jgi:hypothetical protein
VLKASVEMRLKAQMYDDWIVMAVDVCVHSVKALEELPEGGREVFREGNADAGGKGRFVVNVGLYPGHQVLDVFGRGHLGGALVRLGVLPKVLESVSG